MTTIMNLEHGKRIKTRELIKFVLENRKQQLILFEELLKPLKDNIKLAERTLKDDYPIETYLKHSIQTRKYMEKLKLKERKL